ncbi:MAG: hypothetical protein ACTTH7_04280 [Treponema sp.]
MSNAEENIHEVPVTLAGTVAIMQYYGPPNYGETPETDTIESHPVLTLQNPLTITIAGQKLCIRSLQIICNQRLLRYPFIAGKNYIIEGNVFLAQTGHHYTEAVLLANRIS